jgi:hypothetical protein
MHHMNRLLIALLLAGACMRAHAVGHLADVAIIDRDTGDELPTHYDKGEYWVAGTPGARYSISVRNRIGERILAVIAVDGVNVISGESAGWNQTGYVFTPYGAYETDGWRKSDAEVAAFQFAAASASYASLTGRPANVGVIGVALFKEREPRLIALGQARRSLEESSAPPPAPQAPQERLGTAHGQREVSNVEHTHFDRLQNSPNELIRIRYDSLPNLIALGIVKPPQPTTTPNPFPASPLARYVPDPPEVR